MITLFRLVPLICCFLFINEHNLLAQDPVQGIRELKQGYLLIRFPAYKSKIDKLNSMIAKAEGNDKVKLQKMLNSTLYERDTVKLHYIDAFQNYYDFSDVGYFMDNESRDLNTAHYYALDQSEISFQEIEKLPFFILSFERTEESKVDALVIYNRRMKKMPRPFPNNFNRGGLGFLFSGIMGSSFEQWRVKKINAKLHKFWAQVN